MRILIAVLLVIQTLLTIFETSRADTSFQFISQWNLVALTIIFTTMAVIQVRHARRINKFTVDVGLIGGPRTSVSSNDSDEPELMIDTQRESNDLE